MRRARRYLRKHPTARSALMLVALAILALEVGKTLATQSISPVGALLMLLAFAMLVGAVRARTY